VKDGDPAALFSLRDAVAVVTGASAGIGVSLARTLAGAGARVALAARRQDRLEKLAVELAEGGAEAFAVGCDVTAQDEVERLVEAVVERFGRVDVLVNNAGITKVVPAEEDSLADFDRVVAVNLRGVFLCCQRFGLRMLAQGRGSIVNVASMLGMVGCGQVPQAAYAASKAGVINLTRELAAQWARRGVRVNCLAPGWFESEMTADMFTDERSIKWMRQRTPMGRSGREGELAGALLYFASEASTFTTGQTLAIDGGWTIV
jgi:NAD(P)-dependent dehydrogenase (short-subunit alcohol dehydrogenase family)